ncbi:MAG: glycosyltransferase family 39 protein [Faecalibacterium sp.]
MLKKIATYGFLALFLATMLWVSTAAWLGVSQPAGNVLLVAVLLCAFFVALYRFVLQRADALSPRKQQLTVGILLLLFVAIATVLGCLTMTYPVSDLEVLCDAVTYWVQKGNLLRYSYYFNVCANTLGNCIFLYCIFKPLSYVGLFMGDDAAECIAIFVNVLMLALALFLLYRITTRLLPKFSAQLLFLLLSLSFAPYYLWAHRYYSDTLSMPFAPLAIWLYLRSSETEHRAKQIGYGFAAGLCLWVGYFIKGSVLIALPALLIFAVFALPWKKCLLFCLPLLIGLCLCFGVWEVYRHNNNWISYNSEAKYKYPATMWLLYGAHGDGNYNDDDVNYLASFSTYAERSVAAKERLAEYYSVYTPASYLSFLTTKFTATWSGAQYDAEGYLTASRHGNWTHYFIMEGQPYYALTQYYCNGWHYAFLAMLLLSTAAALYRPRWDAGFLLRICLFGLTLFLCFWETKPRYLLSFAPFFPLFFAQGVLCLNAGLAKGLQWAKQRKRLQK